MGIHGLWQVLEPTGRPINIHSLRGKVLAVDVSIWLHQLVKGLRDKDGNPLQNAHLIGVFHRVCKLLNYGIKPVFVFDGGVPVLKRQTLAARRQRKLESLDKAELSRQKILATFLHQQLSRQAKTALPPTLRMQDRIGKMSSAVSPTKRKLESNTKGSKETNNDEVHEDLESFRAALVAKLEDDIDEGDQTFQSKTTSDSDDDPDSYQYRYGVDYSENFSIIQEPEFDTLPLETQHEILFEMQESRKMNSWGKFDQMPKDLQTFSNFQMDRLVKRRALQKKIQSVQQEMGQRHIHVQNLDDLLKLDYDFDKKDTQVTGSKEDGFVLIKSQEPKKEKETKKEEPKPGTSSSIKPEIITIDDFVEYNSSDEENPAPTLENDGSSKQQVKDLEKSRTFKAEIDYSRETQFADEEDELQIAIQLSLMEAEAEKKQFQESNEVETINSPQKKIQDGTDGSTLKSCETQSYLILPDFEVKTKPKQIGNSPSSNTTSSDTLRSSHHMIHCAKFLDTVGFHIPVSESKTYTSSAEVTKITNSVQEPEKDVKIEASESESDNDFEEVEDTEAISPPSLPCSGIKRENEHMGQPETVACISLSSIQRVPLQIEEDIFADIFDNVEQKKAAKTLNAEANKISKSHSFEDKDEVPPINSPGSFSPVNGSVEDEDVIENANWESNDEIEADLMRVVLAESAKAENNNMAFKPEKHKNSLGSTDEERLELPTDNESSASPLTREKNQPLTKKTTMITAEYMQTQEKINSRLDRLQSEKGLQERVATSISDQMQVETQELISLFGIPFVVSPTEAESQCAFFDKSCLTEGSITDDSDVWVFGGQRVYKNFFSQGQRPVEFYQAADIQRVLNLNREKLIALAMLIGSDYSLGVQGVGPVLALEILSEFSSSQTDSYESLVKFREWWEQIQSKSRNVFAGSKVKEKLRKLNILPGFPNRAVFDAFMNPSIDTSMEAFKWGNPDLDAIRSYVKQKFGWEQSKCDSFLLPVLKNLRCEAEQGRQLTLDSYISIGKMPTLGSGKRKKASRRIETAVKKLKRGNVESRGLNLSSESESDQEEGKKDGNFIQKVKSAKREHKVVVGRNVTNKREKKRDQASSSSSSSMPSTTTEVGNSISRTNSAIRITPRSEVIPQRIQAESDKRMKKQKAIDIFTKKKGKE